MKPISVVFDQSSMYGNREGHHSALVVTSQDKGNVFWKSQLWKAGVVTGVGMLPRNLFLLRKFCALVLLKLLSLLSIFIASCATFRIEMRKAEKVGKFGTEARLTRVQELKQATASKKNMSWW